MNTVLDPSLLNSIYNSIKKNSALEREEMICLFDKNFDAWLM